MLALFFDGSGQDLFPLPPMRAHVSFVHFP